MLCPIIWGLYQTPPWRWQCWNDLVPWRWRSPYTFRFAVLNHTLRGVLAMLWWHTAAPFERGCVAGPNQCCCTINITSPGLFGGIHTALLGADSRPPVCWGFFFVLHTLRYEICLPRAGSGRSGKWIVCICGSCCFVCVVPPVNTPLRPRARTSSMYGWRSVVWWRFIFNLWLFLNIAKSTAWKVRYTKTEEKKGHHTTTTIHCTAPQPTLGRKERV